jgi:hypothetical protein
LDATTSRTRPKGGSVTKEQILDTIKLLSALEAWSFANNHRLPDYLLGDLDKTVEFLTKELLK